MVKAVRVPRSHTLPPSRARLVSQAKEADLTIGPQGAWFRAGSGPRVELGNGPLRRLLTTLAEYRIRAPGAPLSDDFLFLSAWGAPFPSAAQVRRQLALALALLERLGLPGLSVRGADQTHLEEVLTVALVEPPCP
jgi:hypothetical protein